MTHRNRWFTYYKWWFSMAMLNNQMEIWIWFENWEPWSHNLVIPFGIDCARRTIWPGVSIGDHGGTPVHLKCVYYKGPYQWMIWASLGIWMHLVPHYFLETSISDQILPHLTQSESASDGVLSPTLACRSVSAGASWSFFASSRLRAIAPTQQGVFWMIDR